jgi:hypothetical protein
MVNVFTQNLQCDGSRPAPCPLSVVVVNSDNVRNQRKPPILWKGACALC